MTIVKWDESMAVRCLARCGPAEAKTYIPAGSDQQARSVTYTADANEAYTSDETITDTVAETKADTYEEEMQIDIPMDETGTDTYEEEMQIDIPMDEDTDTSEWYVFRKSIDKTLPKKRK